MNAGIDPAMALRHLISSMTRSGTDSFNLAFAMLAQIIGNTTISPSTLQLASPPSWVKRVASLALVPSCHDGETTMSKQEMARRLIELGSVKAFNTLRKYPHVMLAKLLATYETATKQAGNTVETCEQIPVDASPVPAY